MTRKKARRQSGHRAFALLQRVVKEKPLPSFVKRTLSAFTSPTTVLQCTLSLARTLPCTSPQRTLSLACTLPPDEIRKSVELHFSGTAQDIYSDFSVVCTNSMIQGSVRAGDGVTCTDVGGDVSAGDSVTCGSVGGDVQAGDGITCSGNVMGNVRAGDSVSRCP